MTNQLREYGSKGASVACNRLRFSRKDESIELEHHQEENQAPRKTIRLQFIDTSIVKESLQLRQEDQITFDGAWFNSSNCWEYLPFEFQTPQEKLLVDANWFGRQRKELQTTIIHILDSRNITLELCDSFEYPHELPPLFHEISSQIYRAYVDQFSFDKFIHLIQPTPFLVTLSSMDRIELLEKTRLGCLTGKRFTMNDLEDFSKSMIDSINSYCRNHPDGVFVKTMEKSAKNDNPLKPLHNALDILQQVASSRDVLLCLEQRLTSHLVLMPWNSHVSETNEYRLFVHNSKPVAMSQQKWYKNVHITPEMAVLAASEAPAFISRILLLVEGVDLLWPDMVIDAWMDYDRRVWHLIEVNPGGISMSSGSSLFEWRADYDILQPQKETNEIFVRIHDPDLIY